ncbi:MAG TPA: TonB-dependent receptor [Casimicrobiaceae bacterium]|nr:TonB-dependent receptor [Casimicrobiaceae bacterium]
MTQPPSCRFGSLLPVAAFAAMFGAHAAIAQDASPPQALDTIVVSATRSAARAFDVPASVDIIDGSVIRDAQPMVNLSETLPRVPGVFAANRQNYAQDLQISSRGFGARAAFGVRGVRLYQDGIPATMPDGQGQTGSFSLFSAQRIEVLRGPFSTLYGNASGGVISVFTEDGSAEPILSANGGGGNYDTFTIGAKLRGSTQNAGYVVAANEFDTQGYRDHSSARRDVVNAKLRIDMTPATRLTLIGNSQYQPETQDPLGLTRAQWDADPRQVDPSAILFDTRKTINQVQGGAAVDHRFDENTALHVAAYGGRRLIRQYLALSGVGPTSSGGVTDLDRDFGGIGARVTWQTSALGTPLKLNVGADTDRQNEHRRGFVNNNGVLGDLRRDEDDSVQSVDGYAEVEWSPWPFLSLTAGVRSSEVRYDSNDHYVTATNPDDSGSRKFSNTSPILGAVWHALPDLNVYASYGQGFETPTFAEMAYNAVGPGLNFTLNAATSRAVEIGVKALIAEKHRLNVALFHIDTDDEIVTNTATGGRTTFKNAGNTRRKGAELLYDGELPWNLRAHVALTYLNAEFTDSFTAGAPPLPVPAGSKLPGVPPAQAYGELAWAPGGYGGFNTGVEVQYVGKIYVNDRNTDAAPAYTVTNVRAGLAQTFGRVSLSEFVRVNNVFDRKYAGSVIVGDTNGRFFEPAPPRNWFVGLNVNVPL